MAEYRTGSHWHRTIIRVGVQPADEHGRRPDDELVGTVDDPELAQRICALLNADDARPSEMPPAHPAEPGSATNLRVEINADGRHIIVEAPGQPQQLIDVALATWRDTDTSTRKPLEAGGGFQLVERATTPTFPNEYPGTARSGGVS